MRGATCSKCRAWTGKRYFNPRTPCGVRRKHHENEPCASNFNPRTPCGVRPPARRRAGGMWRFQSTHPLRGATGAINLPAPSTTNFNPRTPCGVRPRLTRIISKRKRFQSTHPLRGATRGRPTVQGCSRISIHAPLAGCDIVPLLLFSSGERFQSTHPLRGAT